MPVNHDALQKHIVLSTGGGSLVLRIQYGGKCIVDQLFVRGKQVLAESQGVFTGVDIGGTRLATISSFGDPVVSVEKEAVTISGIRLGNETLQVEEKWVFVGSDKHIRWGIERTYRGDGVADEVLLPLWTFPSLSTWTAAMLGTGGVAWFRLFDTVHATYAVHTDSVTFWNADSGQGLRIAAVAQQGQYVAVRFSRLPGDQVCCSFVVTHRELVPRYDPEFHRRRYLPDREDAWNPEPVSGSVSVEYELTAIDYNAEYDRGTFKQLDKKAMGTLMNTIARIGVIDRNLHGSNSWRTPFGPVCLHEQFIAQIGLALDGDEYLKSYKQTLDYYRDHAIGPEGRVKARWAYTCEDAMPGTCDALGFYEAQWGYLLDSNCDYVTNVAELFELTGDFDWVRGQKETCEQALGFLLKRDTDGDGLVEMMTDSHTRRQGSDWIDVIWASHRNAFVNAKLYYALTLWSAAEELLEDSSRARTYRDFALSLKETFNKTTNNGGFWDPGNRWYVYWLDRDNSVHGNNLVIPVNFMAIAYGICDNHERRSAILDRVEAEMKKEDLFSWPLCMFSFADGEGMEFQYPFPNYENGDIFLAWGEVGVRAYASYDPRIAVKYIDRLLAKYIEDGLAFQRYSRLTQKGLGDDILANNCLTIVGLFRNIYGIQPKYNRLYLEPHSTKELAGTIVKYRWRGQPYAIHLQSDGCEVSMQSFTLRSSEPFAVNGENGKLEYFFKRSNRPSMTLQTGQRDSVHLTIEEWPEKNVERRRWSERCSSAGSQVAHRISDLTPGREYQVVQNGIAYLSLKADDDGVIDFEIRGGYVAPQSFEIRAIQRR
ncbi:MAG: hypothetical protein HY562_09905 [Ignavibacteriales bacterium]|nr:hypothetical protein [Ignavibacteriales bacterium]